MTKPMRSENFSPLFHDFCNEVVIQKVFEDEVISTYDYIIKEEKVSFLLNNEKFLSVMSIAKNQDAHIVGFLLSEAVIQSVDDISAIEISADGLEVNVSAKISQEGYANLFKEKTLTSGCCIGVTGNAKVCYEYSFIKTPYRVKAKEILQHIKVFNKPSDLFDATGCVHRAELILEDGTIYESEDIGRHNAIDKVIGQSALAKRDIRKSILYTSGRLSMEMVVKCVMHRIPIVVSKSAVTFQGIEAAKEHGITLVGFARNHKLNVYTYAGRIE